MRTPVTFSSLPQPTSMASRQAPTTALIAWPVYQRPPGLGVGAITSRPEPRRVDRAPAHPTYCPAVGPLLFLLCAATGPAGPTAPPPVVLEVEPGVIAAAKALGPGAAFFTSRVHPLPGLGQLRD